MNYANSGGGVMTRDEAIVLIGSVVVAFVLGLVVGRVIGRGDCGPCIAELSNKSEPGGLWVHMSLNNSTCKYITENYGGNWVCINLKSRNYESAFNVLMHEIGHEEFYIRCRERWLSCMEYWNDVQRQNELFAMVFMRNMSLCTAGCGLQTP